MYSSESEYPDIDVFMDDVEDDFELDFELEPPSSYLSYPDADTQTLHESNHLQTEDGDEVEGLITDVVEVEEDEQSDHCSDASEISEQTPPPVIDRIEDMVLSFLSQLAFSGKHKDEDELSERSDAGNKAPSRSDYKVIIPLVDRKKSQVEGVPATKRMQFPKRNKHGSSQALAQLFRVLDLAHEATLNKIPATKRDIYYQDVPLFKTQKVVDTLVDDLAATFQLERSDLNIRSSSKGLICGSGLTINLLSGEIIHCHDSEGTLIPPGEDIETFSIDGNVSWILIVEKEAVFQTLCRLQISRHDSFPGPGIIITGKGYPDVATRHVVKSLADALSRSIPILGFMDGDPFGLDILSVYKYGSRSMQHENEKLATKRIKWLGIWSSELERLKIGKEHLLPITKHDEKKALIMLRRKDVPMPKKWKKELQHMVHNRRKAEIEILSSVEATERYTDNHQPKVNLEVNSRSYGLLLRYLEGKITEFVAEKRQQLISLVIELRLKGQRDKDSNHPVRSDNWHRRPRPMAPARSSTRRGHPAQVPPTPPVQNPDTDDPNVNKELFLDPMLGTPLAIYIEKDVEDKDTISQLIIKHGGLVSPGYSGVPYILVDPHKESGQNLWRQYAGKKGKIVLNATWVHECIKMNQLQTFQSNWAGCKVLGTESVYQASASRRSEEAASSSNRQIQSIHPHALQATMPPVDPNIHSYPFQVYAPPPLQPTPPRGMPAGPPQWQVSIAPAQTHLHGPPPPAPSTTHPHMIHRPPAQPLSQPPSQTYRDDAWDGYSTPDEMAAQPAAYDYRYREDQAGWVAGPASYYEPSYDHGYGQPTYIEEPAGQSSGSNSVTGQPSHLSGSSVPPNTENADKPRGRKRTRTQAPPAASAASLVVNRNPPARSPTPPTRVIKSTYGGNLFTADDVIYLKKYIDYCQDQCLVLSLREICERIAVKAPHHTFYSWRRYCNKHQIRLGGYTMNHDRSESPSIGDDLNIEMENEMVPPAHNAASTRLDMSAATAAAAAAPRRNRSPTPPRALFRSTTGKGVAFTQEDVTFLVRFMEYRKSQGVLDMVSFWKDVAAKAPHHSRASWMKFWRRHKHELTRTDGDEPLPAPPDKKMRYSREDDILLAKYFYNKPDGTSDKIFQAFGRLHPHHPWKGWQEHHRIHKTKIEHLMQLFGSGQLIEGTSSRDMDES